MKNLENDTMNQTPKEIYDEYRKLKGELEEFEGSIPDEAHTMDVEAAFAMAREKLNALITLYGDLLARRN